MAQHLLLRTLKKTPAMHVRARGDLRVKQALLTSEARVHSNSPLGPVLLLALSYGLVLCAPWAPRMLHEVQARDPASTLPWVVTLAAVGLSLVGAASMIAVMMKVVRSMDRHPYASLASALGVLIGIMLLGLDTSVRIGLLDSTALTFLCLVTNVLGGGLTQRGRGLLALAGVVVATLPAELVLVGLWAESGYSPDMLAVLSELSTPDRVFLGVLAGAGVLFSIVAVVARTLVPQLHREHTGRLRNAREERTSTKGSEGQAFDMRSMAGTTLASPLPHPVERERLARAMSLAIADLPKRDMPPTPAHFSVWTFHDTVIDATDDELQVVLPQGVSGTTERPRKLMVGALCLLLVAGMVLAWFALEM